MFGGGMTMVYGFFFGIYLGMKVFTLHPEVIDPVFNFFRLVSLSKLFRHVFSLQFIKTQACL